MIIIWDLLRKKTEKNVTWQVYDEVIALNCFIMVGGLCVLTVCSVAMLAKYTL